jgi:hypothetical protein
MACSWAARMRAPGSAAASARVASSAARARRSSRRSASSRPATWAARASSAAEGGWTVARPAGLSRIWRTRRRAWHRGSGAGQALTAASTRRRASAARSGSCSAASARTRAAVPRTSPRPWARASSAASTSVAGPAGSPVATSARPRSAVTAARSPWSPAGTLTSAWRHRRTASVGALRAAAWADASLDQWTARASPRGPAPRAL